MFELYKYCSAYENVYFVVSLLLSVGIVVTSLEFLTIHKEFRPDGVFSWKVFSSRPGAQNLRKVDFLFGHGAFLTIHALRIISCVILPFAADHYLKALLISVITVSSLLLSYRNIIGNDGSDQMNSVICITLFISFLCNDVFIYKLGLVFIASQSILSYVIAGVAKIVSPIWRLGIAIPRIMNTRSYGHEGISKYLSGSPKFVKYALSWNIMLFEIFFFLVVLLPNPWFSVFLIWGVLFHIYNAVMMGLNNFFWSFIATYPALIFLNHLIMN